MVGGEGTKAAGAPAEAEMDLDFSRWGAVPSFEFAFNSENFSDRVLQLEVVARGDDGGQPLPDSARCPEEEADKGQSIDFSSTMAGTTVLTVRTLHINSAILAARSPFFLKLFSNGMKESDQVHPRIRIADSEEDALMELLSFMYSGKLTSVVPALLLDILMAADKFEVPSCMRHCSQLLTSLPMTTESALLYLDHPCSVLMVAEVQHVVGAAKEFLTDKYKDLDKFEDEVMNISLAGIEAIFSSTDMEVESEGHVYRFLLKWARARYLEPEERHEILSCRLLPLVRFSHMRCTTLKEILACTDNDIDHGKVHKRIAEALVFKDYQTDTEGVLPEDLRACWQPAKRAYKTKPVKVVMFDPPCRQAIVYLGIEREECSRLFPSGEIYSQSFFLAGHEFRLAATCEMNEAGDSDMYSFGLYIELCSMPECSESVTIDFEFGAKKKPSGKFVSQSNNVLVFSEGELMLGCEDIFGTPWWAFIADDNLFIDGVLNLRADLSVVEQPFMTGEMV
uniref:Uncharacterized protein n=2 Tax=Avena sativa TaxID=4498 RepID=A0ACD5WDE4_AVESA